MSMPPILTNKEDLDLHKQAVKLMEAIRKLKKEKPSADHEIKKQKKDKLKRKTKELADVNETFDHQRSAKVARYLIHGTQASNKQRTKEHPKIALQPPPASDSSDTEDLPNTSYTKDKQEPKEHLKITIPTPPPASDSSSEEDESDESDDDQSATLQEILTKLEKLSDKLDASDERIRKLETRNPAISTSTTTKTGKTSKNCFTWLNSEWIPTLTSNQDEIKVKLTSNQDEIKVMLTNIQKQLSE